MIRDLIATLASILAVTAAAATVAADEFPPFIANPKLATATSWSAAPATVPSSFSSSTATKDTESRPLVGNPSVTATQATSPYSVATPIATPVRPASTAVTQPVSRFVQTTQGDKSDLEMLPMPAPVRNVAPTRISPAEVSPVLPVVSGALYGADPVPSTMVTLDADFTLWFIPNRRAATSIAGTDPLGTVPTRIGDTLGDEHIDRHMLPGARTAIGYWWMTDNPWVPGGKLPVYGVEARFQFIAERSVNVVDEQSPTLVRPFFNLNTGTQSGVVVATPGLATGGISASASERMWGAEANAWANAHYDWPGTTCSIEAMVGFRYLDLRDTIGVSRTSTFVANPVGFPDFAFLAGNQISEQESFIVQNRFFGGQVGIRGNMIFDTMIVTGQLQLAVGNTNEQLDIEGFQRRTLPNGTSIVSPGALLALPSNIGRHYRNELTLVPEAGAKLTFPVNDHLNLGVGFTTMYWSRVARAADQVDRTVDVRQIPSFPGAATAPATPFARPTVPFNQSDLWLMGFMVSAEVKW
jgi:hypothetical protein